MVHCFPPSHFSADKLGIQVEGRGDDCRVAWRRGKNEKLSVLRISRDRIDRTSSVPSFFAASLVVLGVSLGDARRQHLLFSLDRRPHLLLRERRYSRRINAPPLVHTLVSQGQSSALGAKQPR